MFVPSRSYSYVGIAIICIMLLLPSCQSSLIDEESVDIENYVLALSVTPDYVVDDITIIITALGDEAKPMVEKSTVRVNYTGSYLDGEIFDDRNVLDPVRLKLSDAISGLKVALPYLGKGGKALVIIPSRHGYGNNPPRGIKSNAVLVYDITLLDFF